MVVRSNPETMRRTGGVCRQLEICLQQSRAKPPALKHTGCLNTHVTPAFGSDNESKPVNTAFTLPAWVSGRQGSRSPPRLDYSLSPNKNAEVLTHSHVNKTLQSTKARTWALSSSAPSLHLDQQEQNGTPPLLPISWRLVQIVPRPRSPRRLCHPLVPHYGPRSRRYLHHPQQRGGHGSEHRRLFLQLPQSPKSHSLRTGRSSPTRGRRGFEAASWRRDTRARDRRGENDARSTDLSCPRCGHGM